MTFALLDCRARQTQSASANQQQSSPNAPKPLPRSPPPPQQARSQPRLGQATGATLVPLDQFWELISREYGEYCKNMSAQYYMQEDPDAPFKRLETRRQRFLPLPAKSEFETTQQYQKRVERWRVEADAAIESYTRNFAGKLYSTYFPVDLAPYDADRGVFSSLSPRFPSVTGTWPISGYELPGEIALPLKDAQEWRRREKQLLLRADYHIGAYCGPGGSQPIWRVVRWTVVFSDTEEIVWSKDVAR